MRREVSDKFLRHSRPELARRIESSLVAMTTIVDSTRLVSYPLNYQLTLVHIVGQACTPF